MTELTLGFLLARTRTMRVLLSRRWAGSLSQAGAEEAVGEALGIHERSRQEWNGFSDTFYTGAEVGEVRWFLPGFLALFDAWLLLAAEVERLARDVGARTKRKVAGLEQLRESARFTAEVRAGARELARFVREPLPEVRAEEEAPHQERRPVTCSPGSCAILAEPDREDPFAPVQVVRRTAPAHAVVGRKLPRFP